MKRPGTLTVGAHPREPLAPVQIFRYLVVCICPVLYALVCP